MCTLQAQHDHPHIEAAPSITYGVDPDYEHTLIVKQKVSDPARGLQYLGLSNSITF
jgi:hypothetical protein